MADKLQLRDIFADEPLRWVYLRDVNPEGIRDITGKQLFLATNLPYTKKIDDSRNNVFHKLEGVAEAQFPNEVTNSPAAMAKSMEISTEKNMNSHVWIINHFLLLWKPFIMSKRLFNVKSLSV